MKIEIPTTCPSCGAALELVNAQLFCRNKSCKAQSFKKIETFAKNMKIKGLGPRTIEKLELETIPDIYILTESCLVERLGEKIGKKLHGEINKSKICEFSTFLSALSIPLIGKTASKKIAEAGFNSIIDLWDYSHHDILGPVASSNLADWVNDFGPEYYDLPLEFIKPKPATTKRLGKVCITGKLNDFRNRTEASKFLEEIGYTVTTTVSKQTDFLVCEDGSSSSKTKKAKQLNIQIVLIKQLEEIAK
jgi:DNA ligase (NAD+)